MAASPELRRPPSSPAEFKPGPSTAPQLAAEDRGSPPTRTSQPERKGVDVGVGACRTPTSKGSQIPPITSCPPAPRKARRAGAAASCKRRLSELELFRVGPELMELLFRPLDPREVARPPASTPATKRRRPGCCRQEYYE